MNKLNSIIFNKMFWSMIVVNIIIMIIGEALYAPLIMLLLYGGISTTIVLLVGNKIDMYAKIGKIFGMIWLIEVSKVIIVEIPLIGPIILLILLVYIYPKLILKILNKEKKYSIDEILAITGIELAVWLLGALGYPIMYNFLLNYNLDIISVNIVRLVIMSIGLIISYTYIAMDNNKVRVYNKKINLSYGVVVVIILFIMPLFNSIYIPKGEVIKIDSCSMLNEIQNGKKYELTQDIDCTGQSVASMNTKYYGTIDGNGYSVNNLEVNGNLISSLGVHGIIQNIKFDNYKGDSIIGLNVGKVIGVKVENSQISGVDQVGIIGRNLGEVSRVSINKSEVKGTSEVGGIIGMNQNEVKGVEVGKEVKVLGDNKLGSVVGENSGIISYVTSSGTLYNKVGDKEYGAYTGLLVGQQRIGNKGKEYTSIQNSVYNGVSQVNTPYKEVGVGQEILDKQEVMQTCLAQVYEDNQDMTNNEYKELLKASGECPAYKLTNGDRKDNYLARNEKIYLEGTEQEICLNDYY
ncbi:MAG: hypothetical protein ACK5HR_01375, partial [Mycoplasmatales bacterium]